MPGSSGLTYHPSDLSPTLPGKHQALNTSSFTCSQARRQGRSPHPNVQKEQLQPGELKSLPKVTRTHHRLPGRGLYCDPSLTEAPGVEDAVGIPASLGLWTPHTMGQDSPKALRVASLGLWQNAGFRPPDS